VRRLRDVGEHAWIDALARRLAARPAGRGVLVGPGDDAAVLRAGRGPLLVSTDALVEKVHFRAGWVSPAALGRRAYATSASDLAAMGGTPRFAVLALEAPRRMRAADLDALVAGFAAAARRDGARRVGGHLVAGPHLALTTTVIGGAPGRIVTRAGARPGDVLYVTGVLGEAGLAVRWLAGGAGGRLPDVPRRVRAGRILARVASAMIDVSDGLLQDAGQLCRASRVGAEIELGRLPVAGGCRRALGRRAAAFAAQAGEDYELLVAIPPARARAVGRAARRLGCPLTAIGRVLAGRPVVRVRDPDGRLVHPARGGFDHFRR
jgi:thiamine-monophosphate kinase